MQKNTQYYLDSNMIKRMFVCESLCVFLIQRNRNNHSNKLFVFFYRLKIQRRQFSNTAPNEADGNNEREVNRISLDKSRVVIVGYTDLINRLERASPGSRRSVATCGRKQCENALIHNIFQTMLQVIRLRLRA